MAKFDHRRFGPHPGVGLTGGQGQGSRPHPGVGLTGGMARGLRTKRGVGEFGGIRRMEASLKQFQAALEASKKEYTVDQLLLFLKEVSRHLAFRIIQLQPVLTGLSKANWQVTAGGSPPEFSLVKRDPYNIVTTLKAMAVIERITKPPVVHITNNVDYILKLEGGSSRKARHGMVSVALQEARVRFARGEVDRALGSWKGLGR